MRQILLDTETTGLEPEQGHRIIEIGCVELVDRHFTGSVYHQYVRPDREIDEGAVRVHGITNDFLADKPDFNNILEPFMEYINGSELIIHNAAFDVNFINHELRWANVPSWTQVEDHCSVLDTLKLARQLHPGQRNSLDALCKRYGIDNSHRELHGALLDSRILAEVYLAMTGGQGNLWQDSSDSESLNDIDQVLELSLAYKATNVLLANDTEISEHQKFLAKINANLEEKVNW